MQYQKSGLEGLIMNNSQHVLDFFLGANTPEGFVSFFDEITSLYPDYRNYVIKGGPGTGKSTLMKQCFELIAPHESWAERIHCSSDPSSLDAVIFPGCKATMADGTPPHVIEPQFPGAFETVVNFCDCWDEGILEERKTEIIRLSQLNQSYHKQCVRMLGALNNLLTDNYLLALSNTDREKVQKAALRLVQKECKPLKIGKGREHRRLLSAITPNGVRFYSDTVSKNCEKIFIIKDSFGASSYLFLEAVREYLLDNGYEFYGCYCPLRPGFKIEHILIPSLSMAFVTASPFLTVDRVLKPERTIHFTRFTDMEQLGKRKQRLKFNQRMAAELLEEAIHALEKAKEVHDELEKQYGAAMDYEKINQKGILVKEALKQRAAQQG